VRAEVVADGIDFGEGPVWVPEGTPGGPSLVVTSVAAGALYRIPPGGGRADRLADTGGGANGAALATDGSIVVTQNGGMDFSKLPLDVDYPYNPTTPGLQLATVDGAVRYLADRDLQAPNDLVVTRDGTVYFTDPPHFPLPPEPSGRVMAYERNGDVRVVAEGFLYCNGIALDRDGTLVVIEGRGRHARRRRALGMAARHGREGQPRQPQPENRPFANPPAARDGGLVHGRISQMPGVGTTACSQRSAVRRRSDVPGCDPTPPDVPS